MQAASNHKVVGRVTAEHVASYNDPITMRANEELTLSDKEDNWHGWIWIWCTNQAGKSGWVPKEYVERHEDKGIARYDYDAIEALRSHWRRGARSTVREWMAVV